MAVSVRSHARVVPTVDVVRLGDPQLRDHPPGHLLVVYRVPAERESFVSSKNHVESTMDERASFDFASSGKMYLDFNNNTIQIILRERG